MTNRYLLPMARNTLTGQSVKNQDLTGARFTLAQRGMAQEIADQLAARMTARTTEQWQGYLVEYTPTQRS
jgi:hypothetical protein